jgi:hypothetical protein
MPLEEKDFYDTMQKVEGRIVDKIEGVNGKVSELSREVGETKTLVKGNSDKLSNHTDDIENLKDKDRGVLALASTIGGAIGAGTAAALKFFGGGE